MAGLLAVTFGWAVFSPAVGQSAPPDPQTTPTVATEQASSAGSGMLTVSKASVLVGSFTVFLLAVFVGFEVIAKVPPTLHTPLMSGSNAISGITIVGAMLTAGSAVGGFGSLLGMLAVVLAMINVVGGFLVTHRMLMMFKKR
jgi:NAD(P) transhydrogenase subunit alpha